MEEFFRSYYNIITIAVVLFAAVIGIFTYPKYRKTPVKYFIYYLVAVFFLELIGGYPGYIYQHNLWPKLKIFLEGTYFTKNYWWYNIFWFLGSICFFSFYYRQHILVNRMHKNIAKYFGIVFIAVWIIYYLLNFRSLFFQNAPSILQILWSLFMLTCSILYYMEILQSEKILKFYKTINFYISTVFFVWLIIIAPLSFYNMYFSTADWDFIILKWQIYLSANMFMYVTFGFALIWCEPPSESNELIESHGE